jgi:acyl-[acyl-carrier-protein]-phospholipid O-acyltransferase/long-chain-fatty-acid--[acyl-carrier-protein] ligase
MVPHLNIAEAIQQFVQGENQDEILIVVTAVPDEKTGERLVVLHKMIDKSPTEICEHLKSTGLPNIWLPSPDSFLEVDEIPVLGTGKLDLKGLSELAKSRFTSA